MKLVRSVQEAIAIAVCTAGVAIVLLGTLVVWIARLINPEMKRPFE